VVVVPTSIRPDQVSNDSIEGRNLGENIGTSPVDWRVPKTQRALVTEYGVEVDVTVLDQFHTRLAYPYNGAEVFEEVRDRQTGNVLAPSVDLNLTLKNGIYYDPCVQTTPKRDKNGKAVIVPDGSVEYLDWIGKGPHDEEVLKADPRGNFSLYEMHITLDGWQVVFNRDWLYNGWSDKDGYRASMKITDIPKK
jgi:hypothetical protein